MKNLTGIAIRKVRKDIGITSESLAKLCGVTRPYIDKIEAGSTNPTDDMMDNIFEVLGIWIIVTDYLKGLQ
jgi:predicted transcriptional regulator